MKKSDRISLFLGYHPFKIPVDIPECEEETILSRYRKLQEAAEISSYPFTADITERKRVLFLSKEADRRHLFLQVLAELSYRYSPKEITIAVCASSDEDLPPSVMCLPHLFVNGERLLLSSMKELRELDERRMKRRIIALFPGDLSYRFQNPAILSVFFRSKLNEEADLVIEYLHNRGIFRAEYKAEFTYAIDESDYEDLFSLLSRSSPSEEIEEMSFRDLYPLYSIRKNYEEKKEGIIARFSTVDNEPFELDLHEKRHGPHGLIGGTTGSGKSELIISLLLSVCIRHSPDDVKIVLIDYKGGGIREALSYQGECVPHLFASVDNLDDDAFVRLIYALKNECIRREKLFRQLSEKTHHPITDIDGYREKRERRDPELAHLLIVVDEFAELKKESPEHIRELISLSRIGRSLGLHLILATQRPSGVIDEEIWSNSRFKIALRVYEEKESMDLLRRKDAAFLSSPGEFCLLLDNTCYRGKSVYAKGDPLREPYRVGLPDRRLRIVKEKAVPQKGSFPENGLYVKEILKVTEEAGIHRETMDFLRPEEAERRKIRKNGYYTAGTRDDYLHGDREILVYPVYEDLLVWSNRKKEMNGYLNTLFEEGISVILIASARYEGKTVRDTVLYEEKEDLLFLMEELSFPHDPLVILIEDLQSFLSYDESYPALMERMLRNKERLGVSFLVFTRVLSGYQRVLSLLKRRILIGSSSKEDCLQLFSGVPKLKGDAYYEEEDILPFVPVREEDLLASEREVETFIRRIPEKRKGKEEDGMYLIGYDRKKREEAFYPKDGKLSVYALDYETLRPYENSGFPLCVYNGQRMKGNEDILWVGPGLESQRLFYPPFSKDISDEEAYLYSKKEKVLLMRLNDE